MIQSKTAAILGMMATFGMFDRPPATPWEEPPPKKCLLEGCDKPREGNKAFCCKEHFGEYQRQHSNTQNRKG